jgi:hypothetical protein
MQGIDRSILALATFKDAPAIGYDGVHVRPEGLILGISAGNQRIGGGETIPFGTYELADEEVPRIEAHAKAMGRMHQTLEMACQRLVDGARRSKPRDTIVDAVIGLESILLAHLPERGELRFRFSLNYATLFPKEERRRAFSVAKDLYDLRSTIAHGSQPPAKLKIGDTEYGLAAAGNLAREVLRRTIAIFAPSASKPEYLRADFWESKQLGL